MYKFAILIALGMILGTSHSFKKLPVTSEKVLHLWTNTSTSITNLVINISEEVRAVPVVYIPFQVAVLTLILMVAIFANGVVIVNISGDSLKRQMSHFLLIRHMCIADLVGALLIIPIPLFSFIKGNWDWGNTACSIISTTTSFSWTMHFITVALYRADRFLANCLSIGRYPILKPKFITYLMILAWFMALIGSSLATYIFTCNYQPALVLCIPKLPAVFFGFVFTIYFLGLAMFVAVNVVGFMRKRCSQRQREVEFNGIDGIILDERNVNRYVSSEHYNTSASDKKVASTPWWMIASNLVSVGHIILYLPAMMAVGMLGEQLSAPVAFLCGVIVYCEVTIQPIALLLLSSRMRREIISGL